MSSSPRSVRKELDRLTDDVAQQILARLAELETNPRPPKRALGLPQRFAQPFQCLAKVRDLLIQFHKSARAIAPDSISSPNPGSPRPSPPNQPAGW